MIIHLEYDPAIGAIQWADGILKDNPSKRAIVTSHSLIGTGNPASFSSIGQVIYDELKDNPNLFLMLCGHVNGAGRRTDIYNGSVVHTLLADYQSDDGGGNGFLRIMEFLPESDLINVSTFSPYLEVDQWKTDSGNEFSLTYDMDGNGFELIGTNTDVLSGSTASITWPGLECNTEYEWYVTVTNGDATITSPVWSFTTGGSTWDGSESTAWSDPLNWSGDALPVETTDVTITADPGNQPVISSSTEAECLNLTVMPGASLTIESSSTTASGSLIVHGTSTGDVIYNRFLRPENNDGSRHIFSSPVAGQTVSGFIAVNGAKIKQEGSVYQIFEWDEWSGSWPIISSGSFAGGHGYHLKQAEGSDGLLTFTGTLNNEPVITATAPYYSEATRYIQEREPWGGGGWNLLGNPFTSSLRVTDDVGDDGDDENDFLAKNLGSFDPSYQAVYIFDGTVGELGSYRYIAKPVPFIDPMTGDDPEFIDFGSKYVQAGQGFFVLANYSGVTFSFTRDMQTHNVSVPMTKSAKSEDSWPGLHLRVSYGQENSYTTIIYNEKMSAGLDPGYDVGQLSSGRTVDIYTTLVAGENSVNFARQALPVSGADKLVVAIGIDSEEGDNITFSAYTVPLGTNRFWLEDRVTGIYTDLSTNTYTATLPAKSYGTGRFFILASANTPTGIKDPEAEDTGLRIWNAYDKIVIKGTVSDKAICEVYDVRGQMVIETRLTDGELNTITLPSGMHGVYLVRVVEGVKVTVRKVALL